MLRDVFSDILSHTYGLGFIEMVKVTTDGSETKIDAIDDDKSVIIYGKLRTPVKELEGTVGFSRMAVLQGYLKFPPFLEDSATTSVEKQNRGGVDVPAEIRFTSDTGHSSSYRFMAGDMAEEQIKVPVKNAALEKAKWNISITPTDANLKDLSYFNNILGTYEPIFTPRTDGGTLYFDIGSGPTDRASVPIAENVSGTLAGTRSWPLVQTLAILKLATKADSCMLKISDIGALSILIETPVSEYEYILPARAK